MKAEDELEALRECAKQLDYEALLIAEIAKMMPSEEQYRICNGCCKIHICHKDREPDALCIREWARREALLRSQS